MQSMRCSEIANLYQSTYQTAAASLDRTATDLQKTGNKEVCDSFSNYRQAMLAKHTQNILQLKPVSEFVLLAQELLFKLPPMEQDQWDVMRRLTQEAAVREFQSDFNWIGMKIVEEKLKIYSAQVDGKISRTMSGVAHHEQFLQAQIRQLTTEVQSGRQREEALAAECRRLSSAI